MFSVIIPVYNKVNYIKKAIDSVLNQTYNLFELIVVDDGSNDGSHKLLHELKSNGLDFKIITQKNSGVSSARNNGVKHASNTYVAFLDADDWWEPDFLKEMYQLILKFPDAGLYSSNFCISKNATSKKSVFDFPKDFEQGYINYFEVYSKGFRQLINSSSVVIPKSIYLKYGGFPENITRGEDFYFWTKIALHEKIAYLNKHLSVYNQDSDVQNRATKKIHNPNSNYVFFFNEFIENEKDNTELKKLLDHIRIGNYKKYVRNGRYLNEAKRLLDDVDFKEQTLILRITCRFPIQISKLVFSMQDYYEKIIKKIQ